jgi:hypothetical protein
MFGWLANFRNKKNMDKAVVAAQSQAPQMQPVSADEKIKWALDNNKIKFFKSQNFGWYDFDIEGQRFYITTKYCTKLYIAVNNGELGNISDQVSIESVLLIAKAAEKYNKEIEAKERELESEKSARIDEIGKKVFENFCHIPA